MKSSQQIIKGMTAFSLIKIAGDMKRAGIGRPVNQMAQLANTSKRYPE